MYEILGDLAAARKQLLRLRDSSAYAVERSRAGICLAFLADRCIARVARSQHRARSTVYSALQRFAEGGVEGLGDGRRSKVGSIPRRDEIVAALPGVVTMSPADLGFARTTWTVELAVRVVATRFGVVVSTAQMWRLLREAGCRLVRPRPTVAKAPVDRRRRIGRLADVLLSVPGDEPVLFADEMDIELNPRIGPDWTPAGQRKVVATPGQNRKHFLAGAYDLERRELLVVDGPRKNSDLFIRLCEHLADVFPDARRIHLVVDNYIVHSSKKTKAALEELGGRVVLHFLPPYCPEDNAIERVWWDVHACVTRNHTCRTIEQLIANVYRYLAAHTELGPAAASLIPLAA